MRKVTVVSPANIAFIKYWGIRPEEGFIPNNSSMSMTLDNCTTTCSCWLNDEGRDRVWVKYFRGDWVVESFNSRKGRALENQLNRLKQENGIESGVTICSTNSFPNDAGIASSASSFSAITGALLLLFDRRDMFEDKQELSRQIRLSGSGSAVRSAEGGFVEFLGGEDHMSSYARQIADEKHWDVVDLVVVVNAEKKKVSSSRGHELATTSQFYQVRMREIGKRLEDCRQLILSRDIDLLGKAMEEDCISMFAVTMTSKEPIYYWQAGSMEIIHKVLGWREQGIPVYFTFDAGANAHLITLPEYVDQLKQDLGEMEVVKMVIENHPAAGMHEVDEHLELG